MIHRAFLWIEHVHIWVVVVVVEEEEEEEEKIGSEYFTACQNMLIYATHTRIRDIGATRKENQ